ncbi:MAG: sulfite exporter TauE/SafE family protein [Bacteroidia bacterium]
MEQFIIALIAAFASLLTFFSGFGLGTILTPVLILFFPVEVAIALTGVVHLLNNLFKVSLTYKSINRHIALRFGITAIIGAFAGAKLLAMISGNDVLFQYQWNDHLFTVTLVKLIIAVLMIVFALFESIPSLRNIQFDKNKLPVGGLISGFFGGLSGNQGALRSMFLIRAGLGKESFIATGILIAVAVDITRLSIYYERFLGANLTENLSLLVTTTLAAFLGAYLGSRLLKKVTIHFVQNFVTVMIIILAIALGLGLI